METQRPLVSVVCCGGTDEESLPAFHGDLFRVLRVLESSFHFEVLYVGDSGNSSALAPMDALAQLDPRIRVIHLDDAAPGQAPCLGLECTTGAMVVIFDADQHPAELLPKLLDKAKGDCEIVEATVQQPVLRPRLLHLPSPAHQAVCLLLKRTAVDLIVAARDGRRSLDELAHATGLPRAHLEYTPRPITIEPTVTSRSEVEAPKVGAREPVGLVTYFGATVFAVGVFLACWFAIQSLRAPDSVWFSWSYLIVLLHILGGSILVALGKLSVLAGRILTHIETRTVESTRQDDVAQDVPTILPWTRPKNAA